MEHSELVQEMVLLEKLPAQERLKQARKRRQQQLASLARREVGLGNTTAMIHPTVTSMRTKKSLVQFPENIVLLEATARQDIEEVRYLLQTGRFNPNTSNEDGLTPIHQCSIDNSDLILSLLIAYGGEVNAKDRDLWTPLHAAATCGHLQICKILIDNGAELLALNADGNMPYDICDDDRTLDFIETQMDRRGITQEMIDEKRAQIENKMLADLQLLVKKSLSSSRSIDDILSFRNDEGATPLHIASANGYQLVVEYLLQQRVSINLQDVDGWTPTHAAAFWCQQPVLSQLIDAGADIYERIPDGRSAVDLCDDPDLRTSMIEYREQYIQDKERAAAAAAAAAIVAAQDRLKSNPSNSLHHRPPTGINSILNNSAPRTGALYESRSSISSPYGSGSSLNRTSSLRRASLRDREKAKKLNESFLDVLQAKDKIQEDYDETGTNVVLNNGIHSFKPNNKDERSTSSTTTTDSTIREPVHSTTTSVKPSNNTPSIEMTLPPLRAPPPVPPPPIPTTADTLSEVKRRREERRRGITGPLPSTTLSSPPPPPLITSPPLPSTTDMNHNHNNNTKMSNGNHRTIIHDSMPDYSAKKFIEIHGHLQDDRRKKRICCTIF